MAMMIGLIIPIYMFLQVILEELKRQAMISLLTPIRTMMAFI